MMLCTQVAMNYWKKYQMLGGTLLHLYHHFVSFGLFRERKAKLFYWGGGGGGGGGGVKP